MDTLQGRQPRWHTLAAAAFTALALSACGGGGGGDTVTTPPAATYTPTPAIATEGLNHINARRSQAGLPALTRVALVDTAAERHSNYQQRNEVTHDQITGRPGFTGVTLADRLRQVNYLSSTFFIGEIISASTSSSGTYLAEELITAIYHRFVMFEPRFKDIGAGSVTNGSGYSIMTVNFGANNGYGPGIGPTVLATWPVDNQTGVTRNFLSDFEAPDPVPNRNEVGYPISVHANGDASITVSSFTVRVRNGNDLQTRLLSAATDQHTPPSAAAIVPLDVLAPNTVYDVSFVGAINGLPTSRTWSFTTRS
jgi:uncharacterized protein YkwD